MASYFDEHDCEPLEDGQQPNHLLHMARYHSIEICTDVLFFNLCKSEPLFGYALDFDHRGVARGPGWRF